MCELTTFSFDDISDNWTKVLLGDFAAERVLDAALGWLLTVAYNTPKKQAFDT